MKYRTRVSPFLALALSIPLCPSAGYGDTARKAGGEIEQALRTLHAQDVEVEAIGYRLARASSDLCRKPGFDPGFGVHTLRQYEPRYRQAAAGVFSLGALPGILAVAPGSPADAAGVREGDQLVSIGTTPFEPRPLDGRPSDFADTAKALLALQAGFAHQHATITVDRGGQRLAIPIDAKPACPSVYQVVTDDSMNGQADGTYVQVSSDLVAYTESPDELAAVLAHELAHNILHHRMILDAMAVSRGMFAQFGRSGHLIRETEIEADRLSIYLLARAGYDTGAALQFWERYGRRIPDIMRDRTHPDWRERTRLMGVERDRIDKSGRAASDVPLPDDLAERIAAAPVKPAPARR